MAYFAFFDEERTFGVEFEVYGVKKERIAQCLSLVGIEAREAPYRKEVFPYWKLSYDNSIVGEDSIEITSPILCGREGLQQVRKVASMLRQCGCQVNSSCGFHVHWNCQDFTGKNVLSLLRFYAKFEGVIDYLVSSSRRGDWNEHCRSLVKDNTLAWVTELDSTGRTLARDVAFQFERRWHSQYPQRSSRYHKVNIQAYNLYGTIEFRQHQGTVNWNKAVNWIVFTQQLVNKAKYGSVSKEPSAKPTLGEMLRVLKIVDHAFIQNQCTDPVILELGSWLKRRYWQFKREEETGED